jgi:hypothetical protein
VIQTEVEDALSEGLLEGRIHDGEHVHVALREQALVVETVPPGEEPPENRPEPEALPAS